MAGDGLGDDGALLLYSTMRKVVTTYNFPPPDGFSSWDEDAIATNVHEFLTRPRSTQRLVQLAISATDDESFERLLFKALHNFMRDQGRRTVVGAVVRQGSKMWLANPMCSSFPVSKYIWRTGLTRYLEETRRLSSAPR